MSLGVSQMLIRCNVQVLTLQKVQILPSINIYLVINKCITTVMLLNFFRHYLHNRSTLVIELEVGTVDFVEFYYIFPINKKIY